MSADTVTKPGLPLALKITLVRIMGIPVFVGLLVYYLSGLHEGHNLMQLRLAALGVFIVIAATDALDGYLARARNEVTRLGTVLDPLADKALILSALIILTRPTLPQLAPHIPIWFTTLVISRDVVLIIGYFLVHHFIGHVEVRPRWSGKIATALTLLAICWVLMQKLDVWFDRFIIVAGICTAISMIQYLVDGARQLAKIPHH